MSLFDSLGAAQAGSVAAGAQDNNEGYKHLPFWNEIKTADGTVLELWKPKMGPNMFDIMPWVAKTDIVKDDNGKSLKGVPVFDVQVDVNMKMGTGKVTQDLISRASLGYGDDAIQEEQVRLFDIAEGDRSKKEFKKAVSLYPKKRSLYLIMVYQEDGSRKPYLYAPAYNSFAKLLLEKQKFLEASGETVLWAHPTLGKTIYLNCTEETFTTPDQKQIKFPGFKAVECMDRKKPYLPAGATDEQAKAFLDRLPSLDEHLIVPTYDEQFKALFGTAPTVGPVTEEAPQEEEAGLSFSASEPVSEPTLEAHTTPESAAVSEDAGFIDDLPF